MTLTARQRERILQLLHNSDAELDEAHTLIDMMQNGELKYLESRMHSAQETITYHEGIKGGIAYMLSIMELWIREDEDGNAHFYDKNGNIAE